ncbi:hypothetical protein J8I29_24870 [Labrys sp. LIt4]|uniref:Uncharacterized protein n=1 Tax=Labrys okinawensis TaxID=346911 RepID=A0A2S9QI61_9HYPH|nr:MULTISPECIES: hypothetical protein [Labrys]MBP0582584.1 hypothetical protein [Labrys sp. LIt4]PRH89049.1 hypothetical protein C5L14_00170 [Labrys okinawensis]
MPPIICRLKRAYDHHVIAVNVDRICFLESNGDSTTISFSESHFVVVDGDLDSVQNKIEDCTRSALIAPLAA